MGCLAMLIVFPIGMAYGLNPVVFAIVCFLFAVVIDLGNKK